MGLAPAEVYVYEGEVADCATFRTSKGHLVCLSMSDGELWCSCEGFFYRGQCRHVRAVADYVCPVVVLEPSQSVVVKGKGRGRR